ncbi:hypothetical protein [Luteibacter sp.]|uniref:hypothetical protein n=1 Tax=Luteibacter sp. TaxID=1886636 RepID=UPI003F7F02A9
MILPLWIALIFIQAYAFPLPWMKEAGVRWEASGFFSALAFWWIALVIPVALGGFLHQLAISAIPRSWPKWLERVTIIAVGLIIPLVLALSSPAPSSILMPRMLIPSLAAMLLYGALASSLRESQPPRHTPAP